MSKIIVRVLIGALIVGGGVYYYKTIGKTAPDLQFSESGPRANGQCPRSVSFSAEGCSSIDSDCNDYSGSSTSNDAISTCGTTGQGADVTDEQFDCVMNLCTPAIDVTADTKAEIVR